MEKILGLDLGSRTWSWILVIFSFIGQPPWAKSGFPPPRPSTTKLIFLTIGSRTCGIAMSDALGMLAHGVETYRFSENAYEKAADYIEKIINENQIKTVVLGLPS